MNIRMRIFMMIETFEYLSEYYEYAPLHNIQPKTYH